MSTFSPGAKASKTRQNSDIIQSIPADATKEYACLECDIGTLVLTPVWVCDTCGEMYDYKPKPTPPPEEKDEITILLETLTEIDRDYRRYRKLFDEATKHCRIDEAERYHEILLQLEHDRTAVFNDMHEEIAQCRS